MLSSHRLSGSVMLRLRRLAGGLVVLLAAQFVLNLGFSPVAQATSFNIPDGDVAALKSALTAPGAPHVINLAPGGLYTLTTPDNTTATDYSGATGLPVVNRDITIYGNGATITRNSATRFRFFYVNTSGKLNLNNLTLSNGNASFDSTYAASGGAILNAGGTVAVDLVTFSANKGGIGGGAIQNLAEGQPGLVSRTANLSVKRSIFQNGSIENPSSFGGAIYNIGFGGKPAGNSAAGTANLTVTSSAFVGNTANFGGAIINLAGANENTPQAIGTANAAITNSTFYNNQASSGAAVASFAAGTSATNGLNTKADLKLTNNTLVGNITSNSNPDGNVLFGLNFGFGTSTALLRNNLLASNSGANCKGYNASFSPGTNNLEYSVGNDPATCGPGSAITAINPVATVAPALNGGPTPTFALAATSPALDAGSALVCQEAAFAGRDGRGAPRILGPSCDVGAFEYGGFVVTKTTDAGNVLTPPYDTLSYALKRASESTAASVGIAFALEAGNEIKVSAALAPVPANVSLYADCSPTGPSVTLDGTGVVADGLKLSGGNKLTGLRVKGFQGRQILTLGQQNRLVCTSASRN